MKQKANFISEVNKRNEIDVKTDEVDSKRMLVKKRRSCVSLYYNSTTPRVDRTIDKSLVSGKKIHILMLI